jgi:steroid delta-isomerase-like uncharacterized protein
MTDLSPEGTVRGMFEALNARDYARAAGPIAEDCEWWSIATETVHRGPSPIVAGLREFATAFPDWHCEIERLTAAGPLVVVEWRTTGTFERPFRGQPPNGRRFVRRGCAVAEVVGGTIVRYRDYYDRATLLMQLGLAHLLQPA